MDGRGNEKGFSSCRKTAQIRANRASLVRTMLESPVTVLAQEEAARDEPDGQKESLLGDGTDY